MKQWEAMGGKPIGGEELSGKPKKKYPRVNRDGNGSLKRRTCGWCGKRTDSVLTVEQSWSRGDDIVLKVCKSCKNRLTDEEILAGHPTNRGV